MVRGRPHYFLHCPKLTYDLTLSKLYFYNTKLIKYHFLASKCGQYIFLLIMIILMFLFNHNKIQMMLATKLQCLIIIVMFKIWQVEQTLG